MTLDNILPSGRRRRIANGVLLAVLAAATTVWLIRSDAIAVWFLLVFVLVFLSALMFLQARDRT